MLKPARPYYYLWNNDQRPLSFDFPSSRRGNLEGLCLFSFAARGEENFIPTSSIFIGAQIAAKEPSSKPAEMLAGVA